MAITIIQEPQAVTPAGNPITFLVQSTNSAQANFRFIAEIKDSGGNVIAKRKFPLIPGTSRGWIDIHRTLETQVSGSFNVDQAAAAEDSSAFYQYSVHFGEEYGDPTSEYLNLASVSSLRTWSASLQALDEWPGYQYEHYRIVNPPSGSARWLSAFGSSKRIGLDQRDFLSFITRDTLGPDSISVVAISTGGITTSSVFAVSPGSGHRLYRIPSGPENLNMISSLISGTPGSVIPANTASYTIQARINGSALDFGPIFSYTIKRPLTNYEPWDFFFWNRFGAFEGFRFDRRSDITRRIQRRSFEKPVLEYDGTSSVGYSESAGSLTHYGTEIEKSLRVISDWISEEESLGLLDLVSSPLVYSYHSGELRQVAVNIEAHRERRKVNDKLEAFELLATFALKDRRQAR